MTRLRNLANSGAITDKLLQKRGSDVGFSPQGRLSTVWSPACGGAAAGPMCERPWMRLSVGVLGRTR